MFVHPVAQQSDPLVIAGAAYNTARIVRISHIVRIDAGIAERCVRPVQDHLTKGQIQGQESGGIALAAVAERCSERMLGSSSWVAYLFPLRYQKESLQPLP